jgi:phenylalanyl-tRNA synthetase beta chain
MRVALSWLKEYVDIDLPPRELAHHLTMAGMEVSSISQLGSQWGNVFIGLVLRLEPHPNADRLKIAVIDLGDQEISAVCGAPNILEGQRVPFAKIGAELFNVNTGTLEILKAARIRGVLSSGMVCSEQELGIADNHEGILILPETAPIGIPLGDYFGDTILDIELTPNRPDCMSMLGIAHEVAALTGSKVREPDVLYTEGTAPIEELVSVDIVDADLCNRYCASIIEGVRIGPSPKWMQDRLQQAGMRPINNVVDITNYVMLEYGQPLHAFDLEAIAENQIVVRRATHGETFITLDGIERTLDSSALLIADPQKALSLAGVMGGANSEMNNGTTKVLLESANFEPACIRVTAASLRLRSEASSRFEKGLGHDLPPVALRRATQLILDICGGLAARGIQDIYPGKRDPSTISLTMDLITKILGTTPAMTEVEEVLTSLGFQCHKVDTDTLKLIVTAPYWRTDVKIGEDLVEEIARITGYDNIPTTSLKGSIPRPQPQPLIELRERTKDILVSLGMQEIISYSLTSLTALEKVEALSPSPLPVANPMSPNQEYLRTTLRASLLNTLAANLHRTEDGLRLFEVGRVYLPRNNDLPEEREKLTAVLAGPRTNTHWLGDREAMDFYDARGLVEAFLQSIGIVATFSPSQDPILQIGKCARISADNMDIGVLGEVTQSVLNRFDMPHTHVTLFDLDLQKTLEALPKENKQFLAISRFPEAVRDIALIVEISISAAQIREILTRHPWVSEAVLFDVHHGETMPRGKRSLAYRLHFQSPSRTFTTEEVNQAREDILESLEQEFGVTLRK